MGSEIIFVVEDAAEGGFFARALGESIFTEAETLVELKQNIREAVLLHFEEGQAPRIIRLHFIKEELMAV
jgi:predicted RNase H-like HicB family nuclease